MVTDRLTDRLTGSQTEMQHTDPVQYTVLGWVKIRPFLLNIFHRQPQLSNLANSYENIFNIGKINKKINAWENTN